jgi:hypothetical protein
MTSGVDPGGPRGVRTATNGPEMTDDGRQAWLCIAPLKLVS